MGVKGQINRIESWKRESESDMYVGYKDRKGHLVELNWLSKCQTTCTCLQMGDEFPTCFSDFRLASQLLIHCFSCKCQSNALPAALLVSTDDIDIQ